MDDLSTLNEYPLFDFADLFDELNSTGVTLSLLSDRANEEHNAATSAAVDALQHAIACGHILAKAKSKVKHGGWLPWLEKNFDGSRKTSAFYMRLANNQEKIEGCCSQEDALRDLANVTSSLHLDNDSDEAEAKPHVANNSGENEWYTPAEYIEAARKTMGGIDLDPASSLKAQETVQAGTFYTAEQDGLSKEWFGNVWMNPPYSKDLIGPFIEKLLESDIRSACVLVNNATDSAWFRAMVDRSAAICFPTGRIRFIDSSGSPSGAPLQGQAICYIGKAVKRFESSHRQFGFVVEVVK